MVNVNPHNCSVTAYVPLPVYLREDFNPAKDLQEFGNFSVRVAPVSWKNTPENWHIHVVEAANFLHEQGALLPGILSYATHVIRQYVAPVTEEDVHAALLFHGGPACCFVLGEGAAEVQDPPYPVASPALAATLFQQREPYEALQDCVAFGMTPRQAIQALAFEQRDLTLRDWWNIAVECAEEAKPLVRAIAEYIGSDLTEEIDSQQ